MPSASPYPGFQPAVRQMRLGAVDSSCVLMQALALFLVRGRAGPPTSAAFACHQSGFQEIQSRAANRDSTKTYCAQFQPAMVAADRGPSATSFPLLDGARVQGVAGLRYNRATIPATPLRLRRKTG